MRRIALSVLAGVVLLGAAVVLLPGASAGSSRPSVPTTARLTAVAPSGLLAAAPARRLPGRSGLRSRLAQFLARFLAANPPFGHPGTKGARASTAKPAPSIRAPRGTTCPAATGSRPGGCSIVPCAVYVATAQASYAVMSGPSLAVAVLPRLPQLIPRFTPAPSPGGRAPAGTCASRPGRPPQMRWVGSNAR